MIRDGDDESLEVAAIPVALEIQQPVQIIKARTSHDCRLRTTSV